MTLFAAGYSGTIVPYTLDASTGHLSRRSSGVEPNSSGTSPSWIAYSSRKSSHSHEGKDTFYAVTDLYTVDETSPGRVFSHTFHPSTGSITHTGPSHGVSSGGDGPVSALIGHGPSKGLLFVANYNSGSASVLAILPDGTLSEPTQVFHFHRPANQPKVGPVADRQDHSYAHQVALSPSGGWVYVCDLGADQIHHLRIDHGKVHRAGSTDVKIGSGPRHITFHKDAEGRSWGYLASELDNTVSAFKLDEQSGKLELVGKPVLASPPGVPLSGPGVLETNRTTAEIAVVPSGDFVYVSERGDRKEDHISIFKRNQKSGELSFVDWVSSGGRMPRHFSLSSDSGRDDKARWLVVGHQTDQNIVVFERDAKTGGLTKRQTVQGVGPVAFTGFSPF
ncbi:Lactonase, 7-bladed beta propeller [Kalmanozyma brasiliensis GHG001]|uniref:3-carboxymuconate cyclase n=1 Tax=Kalmanozyma brasiliensis (strain GHG001) TaxID=1365824 RepID=V5EUL7_KALBG|nr:Lactonase, 7-bladed beta propeller [Kalmanozyma brasiliensis GHG001]EST05834.1 Lactonase, 7-bladed beta propeller [Kalmanozyma brasiliensis GHG001]